MTKEEIKEKIAKLKDEDFDIQVSSDRLDRWQSQRLGEINREIRELEALL